MVKRNGYQAMITQHTWMFLSSFEKLRAKILQVDTVNMAHLGARAFEEIGGEVVQTTSFVLRRSQVKDYKGTYCRLIEPTTQQGKEDMFLVGENRYATQQGNFSKIPGSPVAYWVSEALFKAFSSAPALQDIANVKVGLQTGNNDLFLRLWHEVNYNQITFDSESGESVKWVPHNKGGNYRKWYGNKEYIVNWENSGRKIKECRGSRPQNVRYYFKSGFTWSDVSSGLLSIRYCEIGSIFDTCAPTIFPFKEENCLMGVINSAVGQLIMDIMSPTIHYTAGSMMRFPVWECSTAVVENYVKNNICISKED